MSWRGDDLPAACWDAAQAPAIIPVEAESTSDGVFLATHSSIPIMLREKVDKAAGGRPVYEQDLLQAVKTQPADQPIIPVLGRSGTGKSHLVRWLRVNLKTKDSTRMIFVPKHRTSLRGVLERILEHATGERAQELRAKVNAAADSLQDEAEARLRLRNTLAVLVETRGARKDGTPEDVELRGYLASSTGLPALLLDPVFRTRVLADDGPIARLVHEKIAGRGPEDKEDAFGFEASDLYLTVDDVSRAGADAAGVAGALTSEPRLRETAAAMLNEQLGPAVSEVFGVGGDDLKDLLVELRVELHRQGLELLVLIEDFSIFQGIQGGLIDAITLIPTQELDLCPLRVVMAVTTGYFVNQMPETVYTRTYKVFDLELPDGHQHDFDPAGFTARYLNAVRVGAARLDEYHDEEHHDEQASLPNACNECPVHERCHAAFGKVDGFGLFPFNRRALGRAIDSQSEDGHFVARDVLTRVIRPVLSRDQSELEEGRFPSAGFAEDFNAGVLGVLDNIEDQTRLRSPGNAEESARRVRLVRFWSSGFGPQNLNPTIHEAFGVPQLPGLDAERVNDGGDDNQEGRAEEGHGEIERPPDTKRPDPALVRAIDRWRDTGELEQRPRNDLRNIVHAAVTAHLVLDDGYGGDGAWTGSGKAMEPHFDAVRSIALDDNKLAGALIPISRHDESDVRALRALAWINHTDSWVDVPNGEELQRLCDAKIREWANRITTSLLPGRADRDNPELARLAHTLLAVSKALGIADAFKSDALSRVRAVFASAPGRSISDGRPLLARWQSDVTDPGGQRVGRAVLQHRLLRLASFTQGAGKPLAIDLPRLLRAVRDSTTGAAWPSGTPELVIKSADAIAQRTSALDALRDEALDVVPDLDGLGAEVSEVATILNTLVTERANAGELPGGIDRAALSSAARAVEAGDRKALESLRSDLERWDELSTDERLRLLTRDWDARALRVKAWLDRAQATVAALERRLAGGPTTDAQREYDVARQRLVSDLNALSAGIHEIDGPEETV
jgi:hypothetical protein